MGTKRRLKVGDKVKYTSGNFGDDYGNPLWNGEQGRIVGTVIKLSFSGMWIDVNWGGYPNYGNSYHPIDLELIDDVPRQLNLFEKEV